MGKCPKSAHLKIHKRQRRAARVILDSPPDASSQPLCEELGWLTLFERVEYNKSILLYKSVNNLSPSYISNFFNFQYSEYYSLRSVDNNNMAIPKHNTVFPVFRYPDLECIANYFTDSLQPSGI